MIILKKKACELGSGIATAHTLSDSMETVLINLARGTGLKGLCGIPPVRGKIIRPLIECTRQEIVAYCHEHRLEYVVDSTNLSRDYVRNQLRLDVIPIFYRINPAFDREIARMTRQLGEDSDYLSSEAEKALKNASLGDSSYRAETLLRLPGPIVSRVLLLAVKEFSGIG
ncbi:MAG TPA: ATP-binding protein, partial [Clostridia bacterium]|nr:ATP-binding protein [Clostridia bacterium]